MGKIKDEQIVMAVISHRTNKEAAAALNISESQLYERMHSENYCNLLNDTVMGQLEHVAGDLRSKLTVAIDAISEIIEANDTPASVRLAAANSLVAHYCKLSAMARGARENCEDDRREAAFARLLSL